MWFNLYYAKNPLTGQYYTHLIPLPAKIVIENGYITHYFWDKTYWRWGGATPLYYLWNGYESCAIDVLMVFGLESIDFNYYETTIPSDFQER